MLDAVVTERSSKKGDKKDVDDDWEDVGTDFKMPDRPVVNMAIVRYTEEQLLSSRDRDYFQKIINRAEEGMVKAVVTEREAGGQKDVNVEIVKHLEKRIRIGKLKEGKLKDALSNALKIMETGIISQESHKGSGGQKAVVNFDILNYWLEKYTAAREVRDRGKLAAIEKIIGRVLIEEIYPWVAKIVSAKDDPVDLDALISFTHAFVGGFMDADEKRRWTGTFDKAVQAVKDQVVKRPQAHKVIVDMDMFKYLYHDPLGHLDGGHAFGLVGPFDSAITDTDKAMVDAVASQKVNMDMVRYAQIRRISLLPRHHGDTLTVLKKIIDNAERGLVR